MNFSKKKKKKTQCFDTTGHAPTQTYLHGSLVDNGFSSKYCCARLITMTKSALTNTEATENKVQFLNLAYRVKGFQCHSNNSLQLLGRKKTTTKQYMLFKSFLCDIL